MRALATSSIGAVLVSSSVETGSSDRTLPDPESSIVARVGGAPVTATATASRRLISGRPGGPPNRTCEKQCNPRWSGAPSTSATGIGPDNCGSPDVSQPDTDTTSGKHAAHVKAKPPNAKGVAARNNQRPGHVTSSPGRMPSWNRGARGSMKQFLAAPRCNPVARVAAWCRGVIRHRVSPGSRPAPASATTFAQPGSRPRSLNLLRVHGVPRSRRQPGVVGWFLTGSVRVPDRHRLQQRRSLNRTRVHGAPPSRRQPGIVGGFQTRWVRVPDWHRLQQRRSLNRFRVHGVPPSRRQPGVVG